ncbi:hypothetical protein X943_001010 [Babesia divergens]|uniref:Uncharacterized protein n=1 Tax=Babesia divergens TaxID=32595 RepID=A0AAD9GIJ4_BABDI|nr:hypothetical protein X943_001010 [Babesia divergens]
MVSLRNKRIKRHYNMISTSKVLMQIQLMDETITSKDMPLAGMPWTTPSFSTWKHYLNEDTTERNNTTAFDAKDL